MKRSSVALTATAGAAAGVLGLTTLALPAGATSPDLPAVSPEKLAASVMTSQVPAMAGTVTVDNNLGLPAIPGMKGSSSLLSGGSGSARVWADGQQHYRLALPSEGGETTVVNDGSTVWKWNSTERAVTKYQPEDGDEHRREGPATPTETAKQLIGKLRQSSKVAVDGTASVAGRDAYELVLTPKPTERTVLREVRIAVGAEKRMPLRVVVKTNGSQQPALKAGFTDLKLAPQDPELFQFTPPAGAKVTSPDGHRRPDPTRPDLRVVGEGWDTVLAGRLPQDAMRPSEPRQGSGDRPTSALGFAEQVGKPVSGDWGRGWVITTRAGSALLTADGRVAAGAVPEQVLTEAMGTQR